MANNTIPYKFNDVYDATKTIEYYKSQLVAALQLIDQDIDMAEGSPMSNIVSVVSVALETVIELSLAMYNDNSPYTASLPALINKYGALYGVLYKSGSPTMQTLQLIITQPCNIYSTTTAEHTAFKVADDNGNIYVPNEDVSFTSAGTYNIMFKSQEYDAISSGLNTIKNILTTTLGIESVINLVPYTSLGSQTESEASYRKRIIQASRFYNTEGTTGSIVDKLLNIGCDDVLIARNFTGYTMSGIPSGSIAIIVAGGDATSITNVLVQNVQSAYMYGFPAVPDPSGQTGVSYTHTQPLGNKIQNLIQINNGVICFEIGEDIVRSNLIDFTNCFTLQDIAQAIEDQSGLATYGVGIVLQNDCIYFYNNRIETPKTKIQMIPTSLLGCTDLYGSNYLDGANQTIVEDGYLEIAKTISVQEDRWQCLVTYNTAVSVSCSLLVTLNAVLTSEQQEALKTYIVSQANENRLFTINQSLLTMDFMAIVKEYLDDNNAGAYVTSVNFKRPDDENWVANLPTRHIYERYIIRAEDITINSI